VIELRGAVLVCLATLLASCASDPAGSGQSITVPLWSSEVSEVFSEQTCVVYLDDPNRKNGGRLTSAEGSVSPGLFELPPEPGRAGINFDSAITGSGMTFDSASDTYCWVYECETDVDDARLLELAKREIARVEWTGPLWIQQKNEWVKIV
jgi:hypothetical protein